MSQAPFVVAYASARKGRCEYCLLSEDDAFFSHEPDHIIAKKHGGETSLANLAWSYFECNRFKGSDIASRDDSSGDLSPLFNPRTDRWAEHFVLHGGTIQPLTAVGRVTAQLLKLNLPVRLEVRETLVAARRYSAPEDSNR